MYNSVNPYALCIGTFDYDFGNLRKLVLSIVWSQICLSYKPSNIIPLDEAFLDTQSYSDVVSLVVKVFKQSNTKQFLVTDATGYYTTNNFMVMCFTFVNKIMWQRGKNLSIKTRIFNIRIFPINKKNQLRPSVFI